MHVAELIQLCSERFHDTENAELQPLVTAIERAPTNPLPVHHLALMCRRKGHLDLWRLAVDIALTLPHITYEQLRRRAHAKLILGDWTGWNDRESRFYDPRSPYYQSKYIRQLFWAKQSWDGKEDLGNRTILVLADGGFGDCIQMLRFIPLLAHSAGRVILGVRPELVSFVQHNFGRLVAVVFRDFEHTMPFQCFTWTMSLPALYGALPPFVPLSAPRPIPRPVMELRPLHVGLCWAGDPSHPMDGHRSLPIAALEPLFARSDIQYYSLQVGERALDATSYPGIPSLDRRLFTFADTANIVSGLDCVVTVDTSIAHLAGSLGVPTFLLLSYLSEFRWGLEDSTPWYPSIRILRQPRPNDWTSVVGLLTATLETRALAGVA